jgi:hypothetical protein
MHERRKRRRSKHALVVELTLKLPDAIARANHVRFVVKVSRVPKG